MALIINNLKTYDELIVKNFAQNYQFANKQA